MLEVPLNEVLAKGLKPLSIEAYGLIKHSCCEINDGPHCAISLQLFGVYTDASRRLLPSIIPSITSN